MKAKAFLGLITVLLLSGLAQSFGADSGYEILETATHPAIVIPGLLALGALGGGLPGVFTADAADTSALTTYVGNHSKKLIVTALNSLDIFNDMKVIRNLRSDHTLTKLTAEAGIRPTNTAVESDDRTNHTYSERKISMKGGMKIFTMIPEQLRSTFMSDSLDPKANKHPFAETVWDAEFAKLGEEINESAYLADFNGNAAAWASGSTYASGAYVNFNNDIYKANQATAAAESPTTHPAKWDKKNAEAICTGLGTIIADEITAANITPVTTGAITSSNAYEKMKLVWRALPDAMQKKSVKPTMWVSYDVFEKYIDNIQTLNGDGNLGRLPEDTDGVVYLRNTAQRCQIRPCTWMGTSQRIIVSPFDNLVAGTNNLDDMNGIAKTVETLHGFKAICKYMLGFQIQDLAAIQVNDQA